MFILTYKEPHTAVSGLFSGQKRKKKLSLRVRVLLTFTL